MTKVPLDTATCIYCGSTMKCAYLRSDGSALNKAYTPDDGVVQRTYSCCDLFDLFEMTAYVLDY